MTAMLDKDPEVIRAKGAPRYLPYYLEHAKRGNVDWSERLHPGDVKKSVDVFVVNHVDRKIFPELMARTEVRITRNVQEKRFEEVKR